MATYYLKATDEQALWEALEAAGLSEKEYDMSDPNNVRPETPEVLHDSPDHTEEEWVPTGAYEWVRKTPMLDVIGIMHRETGDMLTDDEGNEYPETEAISGYHANLRANLTPEQVAVLPTVPAPATPYRIWAGD